MKALILALSLFFTHSALAKPETCAYKWKSKDVKLTWTAFKTSEKLAVNGTFKQIQLGGPRTLKNYEEGIKKTHFRINTNSVDTGAPDRDIKIRDFFFGPLKQKQISGRFKKENNQWFAEVRMNKVTHRFPVKTELNSDETRVDIKGSMDVLDWQMAPGLEGLNKVCMDLHKGPDGVSKTWSQVDIAIEIPLEKKCKSAK